MRHKILKNITCILLIVACMVSNIVQVSAAGLIDVDDLPDIYICGTKIEFNNQHPRYEGADMYIPVRETFETIGAKVDWVQEERKATVKLRNIDIVFDTNTGNIFVDNKLDKEGITIKNAVYTEIHSCYVKLDMLEHIFNIDKKFLGSENKININDGMPLSIDIGKKTYSKTNEFVESQKKAGKVIGYTINGLEIRKHTFKLLWIIPLWSKIYVQDLDEKTYFLYTKDKK